MQCTTPPSCLLLDRLPPEMRLEIFKYLLVARFTMHEADMKSKEYALRRAFLLRGLDHSMTFHPSILCANRQIYREAHSLFVQENTFVLISYHTPVSYRCDKIKLEDCGAVVLAEAGQARTFPGIGMTIDFKACDESVASGDGETRQRRVSVITVEDLPAACVALQQKINKHNSRSRKVQIRITVSPQVERVSIRSKGGSPATGSKLSRCLEPLRRLRWIHYVEIIGSENVAYTADIIAIMRGRRLSAAETMILVAVHMNRADKASVEGADRIAIARYKDAINVLRGSFFDELESDEVLADDNFKGLTAAWARDDTYIRLHARIAAALLRNGSHRLARVYVERIYGPLHSLNDRAFETKFPLEITWGNEEAHAEILVVAAQISLSHGQAGEAFDELRQASSLDPENKEVRPLLEQCEKLLEYRGRRSTQSIEQLSRDRQRKEAALEVARTRAAKGNEAYKNKEYMVALRKYETAYDRLHKLEGHWENNWHPDATSLAVEILPKLTTVCLEIQDYEGVQFWSDIVLDFVPGYIYERHAIDAYMRTARFTAHYSKAYAFQKQGKINGAIRHYEKALSLDSNVYTAIKQLQALKQAKEIEETYRRSEEDNSRQRYVLLHSRREKKARQKLVKKTEEAEKRTRGLGYMVGLGSSN